ncbi:hypothetical protein RJ640_000003 [Escallonia rubra]|uniref:Uncharacterized protein n=1 Tax=Escallonia rubra TaxID=112253 RepID=A0AA88RKZ0_9ASTE|nr:hypothetical protein RJ640_000003 [Escallonia rubra]
MNERSLVAQIIGIPQYFVAVADVIFSVDLSRPYGDWYPPDPYHIEGSFTGIPESISNASKLISLDLTKNNFSGIVPNSLGNLGLLKELRLGWNNFISEPSSPELSFINSLTKCTKLRVLAMSENHITGTLPVSIGNLSASLQEIYAQRCGIRGTIPDGIGNLSGLITLNLFGNDLSGSIPSTINRLQKLQGIDVGDNKLRGLIPDDLCQLRELSGLYLSYNQLFGLVPACLGNITSLRQLDLSSNKLTSTIPASLGNLKDLLLFRAYLNFFHGNLPSDIGNLKVLTKLDLAYNNFSGDIPGGIGDMQNLVNLYLEHNEFMGTIPETFQYLVSLEKLDLSQNNLSGVIPKSLDKLFYLRYFNVSYNKLHGEIPNGGPFGNFTSQSFLPNEALCGATQFGVRPCKTNSADRLKTLRKVVIISVSSAISLVVLVLMSVLLWIRCRKSKRRTVEIDLQPVAEHRRISHQEIQEATKGFEESNLLGNGSFGSVYKGILSDGMVLAIKILMEKVSGCLFPNSRDPKDCNEYVKVEKTNQAYSPAAITGYLSSIESLSGTNFRKWKEQISIILGVMDLDYALRIYALATLTAESFIEQEKAYEKWERSNRISLMIMKGSITTAIRGAIPDSDNAKLYLAHIEEQFQGSSKAHTTILITKMVTLKYS